LDDKSLSDIILFSKKVSKALKKVTKCKRVGMSVIGLEVPHAHIHLVPLNKMDDMNFGKKRVLPSSSELISICKKIQSEII
jgi:histidine triad (HIT) family protein